MGESGERMIAVSDWHAELDDPHGNYWREEMRQQR